MNSHLPNWPKNTQILDYFSKRKLAARLIYNDFAHQSDAASFPFWTNKIFVPSRLRILQRKVQKTKRNLQLCFKSEKINN